MVRHDEVLSWLLDGDPAVARRARQVLLDEAVAPLAIDPAGDSDAATVLRARHPSGHWGQGFYQPKWTSTHYSLLELVGLGLDPTLWPARSRSPCCCARTRPQTAG